jgi:hypothetical protein
VQGCTDVFRHIRFVNHLVSNCIPSPLSCQASAGNVLRACCE